MVQEIPSVMCSHVVRYILGELARELDAVVEDNGLVGVELG